MLSSVLNSDRAVQMNILIVRAFVQIRELLATNKDLATRIEKLEAGLAEEIDELNLWIDANVIGPVESASGSAGFAKTVETVKAAIRTKVLESYHNGQDAGPRKPFARPFKKP